MLWYVVKFEYDFFSWIGKQKWLIHDLDFVRNPHTLVPLNNNFKSLKNLQFLGNLEQCIVRNTAVFGCPLMPRVAYAWWMSRDNEKTVGIMHLIMYGKYYSWHNSKLRSTLQRRNAIVVEYRVRCKTLSSIFISIVTISTITLFTNKVPINICISCQVAFNL